MKLKIVYKETDWKNDENWCDIWVTNEDGQTVNGYIFFPLDEERDTYFQWLGKKKPEWINKKLEEKIEDAIKECGLYNDGHIENWDI